MPVLSIGLPFYNNEHTLEAAIRSVMIQSYTDWELFLLDDGSTDGSLAIARKLAAQDPRIQVITDGVNRGLIYRLNQAIDLATGIYIARMDSDDMMMPQKLEKQLQLLLSDNSIDVVDTAAFTINEADEPTGMRGMGDLSSWTRKMAFKNVLLFHPTVIAKASWYRNNKYDPDFIRSEDFELWCRSFNHTRFARVYEPLFLYREGKVNIKNYTTSNRTHRRMLRRYGPEVLSPVELNVELIRSHLKSTLYRCFSLLHMQHLLAAKRNTPLKPEQEKLVRATILRIKSMK